MKYFDLSLPSYFNCYLFRFFYCFGVLVSFSIFQVLYAQPPQLYTEGLNTNLVQRLQNDFEKAIKKENDGDKKEASRYYNNIASMYWEQKLYVYAVNFFDKSYLLNDAIGNETGKMGLINNYALIYADMGQYQKSLTYFEKVLAYRKTQKEPESIFASLINIAVVCNRLQAYEQGIKYVEEAKDIAQRVYNLKNMRLAYGSLYELYDKVGNTKKTKEYFELYKTIHEELIKGTLKSSQDAVKETEFKNLLLEKEKKIKELLLEKAEQKLVSQNNEIKQLGQEAQALADTSDKLHLAVEYLKKDAEIKQKNSEILQLKNQKEKADIEKNLEKQRTFNNYYITVIAFMLIIGIILIKINYDRRKRNKILYQQKTELKASNQVKDKLFSIIAHDLRAPFNALNGFISLLNYGNLSDDETKSITTSLQKTSATTLETLDILLSWAKSQMNGINAKPENIDAYQLAQKQVDFFASISEQKYITIENFIAPRTFAWADTNQMDTVLRNLVSNAIKFTPKNGKIVLDAIYQDGKLYVSVTDTGIGISQENLKKLFKTETHFTTKGTEREKGTGLGLMLCKEFIEANKGEIFMESQIGQGTKVYFSLPTHG